MYTQTHTLETTQVPAVLKLLLERLRNEITRLPAVKATATLAHSPLELGLGGTLDASMVGWQFCDFVGVG